MKSIAKLIIQRADEFLIMYRSSHPTFAEDPDLPDLTGEVGEPALYIARRKGHVYAYGW